MLIEIYYRELSLLIENYDLVNWYEGDCDQRGFYEGFIKLKINFKDNSILHVNAPFLIDVLKEISAIKNDNIFS